jgi:plastocyanin
MPGRLPGGPAAQARATMSSAYGARCAGKRLEMKGTPLFMRRLAVFGLPLLLVLALGVVGCGKSGGGGGGGGNNTVDMTASNFTASSNNVKVGVVHFTDPASGSTHVLCIGQHQSCASNATGPSELTGGNQLTINAGETKDVTFNTPGDYNVTCTVHSGMDTVLHVTQ